jgi:protein-disulfide isomerase
MTRFFAAAALALTFAGPLAAQDQPTMTDAERQAFRAEVRAYLLENPEVLMEAIAVLEQRQAAAAVSADTTFVQANADALFNDGYSWVGGNPDGDLTIVEFMDYRCGYCRRAFEEVNALLNADGNIRFIVKEFPILGDQSVLSAQFAIAVKDLHGDEAYHGVHDALMTMASDVTPDTLARLAETFGLDVAPVFERMQSPEVAAIITRNRELGQRMQITGTPTFVFGGQMVRGYVPLDQMKLIVEQVRADNG